MAKLPLLFKVATDFADIADCVIVYIDEAHAADEWKFDNNNYQFKSHECLEDRLAAAQMLLETNPVCHVWVETMANESKSYAAFPERLYILYNEKVAYAGRRGPHGYHPEEVHEWLQSFDKKAL